jgi:ABC-type glycerol-3-phosphate transport system substrate-binding protein
MRSVRLLIAAILAMMLLLLFGCGNAEKGPVKLQFAWWGNEKRHNATIEAVKLWNASHPDIQVETYFQGYDGYSDKLVTQFAGKTAPDIFQIELGATAGYATKGQLLDLTPYMKKEFAGLDESLKAYFIVDKKNYSVSSGVTGPVLVYNKTYLDKLGAPAPTDNETLETLLEKCKQVTRDTNGDGKIDVWGIGDPVAWNISDFIRDFALQSGIDVFAPDMKSSNFGDPALVALYKMLGRFRDAGVCPAPGQVTVKEGGNEFTSGYTVFYSGSLSSVASTMSSMKDEVGVAALPVVSAAGDNRTLKTGLPIGIYSGTKHKREAVAFLSWFLTSPDAAKVLGMVRGILPSKAQREASAATGDKASMEITRIATFYDSLKHATGAILEEPVNIDEWGQLVEDTVQEYQYRKITIEQMCETIKKLGDPILAQ